MLYIIVCMVYKRKKTNDWMLLSLSCLSSGHVAASFNEQNSYYTVTIKDPWIVRSETVE